MRRRSDDWINATHILKVADFDKPQRTRILEREVQKGVHEKVQGGYGKYQGATDKKGKCGRTANLLSAKALGFPCTMAGFWRRKIMSWTNYDPSSNSCLEIAALHRHPSMRLLLHQSQERLDSPRPVAKRMVPHYAFYDLLKFTLTDSLAPSQVSEDIFDSQVNGETPDNDTIASESMIDDDDMGQYTGSRKRKRGAEYPDAMSLQDQQHQLWADELLDYFMLHESDNSFRAPPEPPIHIDVNRQIDEKGHTALHWAAAMGDIGVVKDLINRGARIQQPAINGDTPLMRAVMFTNNYDKGSMDKLFKLLEDTVGHTEWFGSTVFHHIAATTQSKSKYKCARYYLDTILNKLVNSCQPYEIERLLNIQDNAGDTCIHICARYGATKCLRTLLGRGAAVDIPNHAGHTGDDEIRFLNDRKLNRRQLSSSPFQNFTDGIGIGPAGGPLAGKPNGLIVANGISNLSTAFPPTGSLAANNLPSPQPAPPQQHHCEAALTLTQQLPHLLLTKTEKLAQQLDAELAERDIELTDSERLARQRQDDLDTLQAQIAVLEAQLGQPPPASSTAALIGGSDLINGDGSDGIIDDATTADDDEDPHDARQRQELALLLRHAESTIESEQRAELDRLLEPHGAPALRSAPAPPPPNPGTTASSVAAVLESADAVVLKEQLQLAMALALAQQERRQLVREVVAEEEVEGMVPGVLRELEDVEEGRG